MGREEEHREQGDSGREKYGMGESCSVKGKNGGASRVNRVLQEDWNGYSNWARVLSLSWPRERRRKRERRRRKKGEDTMCDCGGML